MANLKNGTFNYYLTKGEMCCEDLKRAIEERNKFDPTYPDPNDERFKEEKIIIDGHEVVDLGLPSGLLWSVTNLGADSFSDIGNYYQYGKGALTQEQTYGQSDYTGRENPLSSSLDSATQTWGSRWRTPTQDEMIELINNTTHEYVTNYKNSGEDGILFTGVNNKQLFLIAGGGKDIYNNDYPDYSGWYWSSSPYGIWTDTAKHMYFVGGVIYCQGYTSMRACGYNIRPVTVNNT